MSFCRITGRSKGLPRPNYFPLLPPISPADAKRFCRITGKSYGLPSHHYIPVLLSASAYDKSRCRITSNASGSEGHRYTPGGFLLGERKRHAILKDYRYVFPVLEGDGEQQRVLRELLDSKKRTEEDLDLDLDSETRFVYTVEERRCSLVFPARLEAAVRDGDVSDVMLSKDSDSLLLRLKQGRNLSVDFKDLKELRELEDGGALLYEGQGPQEEVLLRAKRKRRSKSKRRKREGSLDYAKRIFEEKEREAEKEEELEEIQRERRKVAHGKANRRSANAKWLRTLDASSGSRNNEIFGHVVQTEMGIEFIPEIGGESSTKKTSTETRMSQGRRVVPGKLVRGKKEDDSPRFVPGIMTKDGFLAGQVVVTEKGEEFVPGQVVDTSNGPKFVPGQMVETKTGEKFVPGQIVETVEGPRFVPGQIVETKAGPTFIPGQIISTDDKGTRFVPGQVVDTPEGPRFLPGRVVESGNGVLFLPGQMVQTEEGPRFVAPDLIDTSEGEFEFSVQGFEVTPEELGLLKLQSFDLGSQQQQQQQQQQQHYVESSIDARMLRQLSEAGLSVGRKGQEELPDVSVDDDPRAVAFEHALLLAEKLGLEGNAAVKMAQVVSTLGQLARNLRKEPSDLPPPPPSREESLTLTNGDTAASSLHARKCKEKEDSIQRTLRDAMTTAILAVEEEEMTLGNSRQQDYVYSSICEALNVTLRRSRGSSELEACLEEILRLLLLPENRSELCRAAMLEVLGPSSDQFEGEGVEGGGDGAGGEVEEEESEAEEIEREGQVEKEVKRERGGGETAVEDFKGKASPPSTFMILKQGLQAVVPREAARSVLTGQIPYTLLAEDGIRHFQPLHVFSALKLNAPAAHKFSMYTCPVAKPEVDEDEEELEEKEYNDDDDDFLSSSTSTTAGSFLSIESSALTTTNTTSTTLNRVHSRNGRSSKIRNGVALLSASSDKSHGYSASGEYTPSFKRLSSIYLQDSSSTDRKSSENFVVVKEHEQDGFSVRVGEIVEAIQYNDERAKKLPKLDPELDFGQVVATLDNSAAKHKISIRPRRNHSDPRASRAVSKSSSDSNLQRIYVRTPEGKEGWLPTSILMQTALSEDSSSTTVTTAHRKSEDSQYRREAVIKELVETEEEFGRDLQLVVDRYLKPLDNPGVPRVVRDNKETIFTNFKQIADFHNTSFGRVLIEGVNYYADQPHMLGKTFLRLERDFDKHVAYCRDEPLAQELLQTNAEIREYFEELSQSLGDDKSVSEHLKLPIQRINDYQLLLKELVKYSTRLGENCDDLQKALDLMLGIPHKATDNKFLSNIEGFKGNIYKLGRLLSHEWFTIVDREDKSKERYLFLFKARILVCKVRRISEDRSVFVLKDIIRLPEVEVKDDPKDDRCFELYNPSIPNYPITLVAHKDRVKDFWLKEIREYASDLVALAEHAADDLQLTEVKEEPAAGDKREAAEKGVPLKKAEPPVSAKRKIEEEEEEDSSTTLRKLGKTSEKAVAGVPVEKLEEQSAKIVEKPKPKSNPSPKPSSDGDVAKGESGKKEEREKKEVGGGGGGGGEAAKKVEKKSSGKEETGRGNRGESKEDTVVDVEEGKGGGKKSEEEMSRRYSSSRYSASSRLVEEYSSKVSSSSSVTGSGGREARSGVAYMESSVSSSTARAASSVQSSLYGTERIAESSATYTSAIGSSDHASSSDRKIEGERTAKVSLGTTPSGKPKFAKTIEGCNVEPGECATFECSLTSSDNANRMLWLKDNKPLEDKLADRVTTTAFDDKRYKLEIQNVHETDSGIYTARATNSDGITTCTAQLVVQELSPEERKARAEANAPIFLVRLKDTELLENTYLRFMIKVKGEPNPELKFFKDGVLIDEKHARIKIIDEKADKGFYELVIADVQKEDAGKYSCMAMNRFGDTSCEATVTVTEEKSVFAGLPEGLLAPGEEPQFSWLRDGQPFDPEERFKVLFKDNEDTLALVFQHVKPEDAGLYTCVAQTSTGNISCSAELTVQGAVNQLAKDPEKPKLQSESKTSEVNVGGSAMLDLQVKGYPKPDIKWTKDGQEIIAGGRIKYLWEDEESLSLVIKQVTAKDAGVYNIRAKNELGEDNTQIELIVKSAPKIVKRQSDINVLVEEAVTMLVQVEASPGPEVKWYKDGQPIEQSERIRIIAGGKEEGGGSEVHKLLIKGARLEDAGSYSIVAKNEVNQTSEMWKLSVSSPPRIKRGLEREKIVKVGESLTFEIEIDSGVESTVQWFRGEESVVETSTEDERLEVTRDGDSYKLRITGVISTDAATYKVRASNRYGTVSDESRLRVHGSPRFKRKLENLTVKEGDVDVEFRVEVESYPKPKVQWFLGDVEITEKREEFARLEATEGEDCCRLILKEAKAELAGKYTCRVSNEYGESSTEATLVINTKPKIAKKLSDLKLKEGETLKLHVEVSGTPEPEVKWFKDGQEVFADARIKITRDTKRKESYDLTMTLVKGSDGGVYEVRAQNEMGEVSCKSKVTVMTRTEERVEEVQQEVEESQKVEVEEVEKSQDAGIEGREHLAKSKVHVVQQDLPTTITISVASTTTHEAVMTGPDEKHLISKLTATKVEVREASSEFPRVEEVASYSYSLQEENDAKSQNGVLIEEFSEGEENQGKLKVNRGVSIVSVSDDESTLKAVSRDDSTDDVQNFLHDDERVGGGGSNGDGNNEDHAAAPSRTFDNCKTPLSARVVDYETIPEERSIEEELLPEVKRATITTTTTTTNGTLERQSSRRESLASSSRRSSTLEPDEEPERPSSMSRQNSRQKGTLSDAEEVDEELEALFDRVKRQRSVLDEILDKESAKESASPEIVSSDLEDRKIFETQSTCFQVKATGLPRPEGKWFKDGKQVRSSDRLRIEHVSETFKLTLSKATAADEGVYSFVATNKLGEKTVEGYLTVAPVSELRKPRFIEPLEDLNVADGDTAEFRAVFTADPVPEVSWSYNGTEISPDDERLQATIKSKPAASDKLTECTVTLKVPKVTGNDTGDYTLLLINKHGEDEASARLDLLLRPEIQEFKDHNAPLEEITQWEVTIVGNPKPKIMWVKADDGARIENDDRHELTEDRRNNKYKLRIKGVQFEDAGNYKVVAENSLGEVASQAQLSIQTLEPSFLKELSDVHSDHREDIELKVRADGIPKPKVKWLMNGVPVKQDDRHFVATYDEGQVSTSLYIKEFSEEDVGTISCEAVNCVGRAETTCQLVMNKKKPKFVSSLPRSAELDEGQPLELRVKVEGSPVPAISWFLDGEPIVPDGHCKIETLPDGSSKLTIERLKPTDCGAYKVVVKNASGEDSSLCAVAVKPSSRKPSFSQALEDAKVVSGEPLRLEARVEAFPNPQIQWFKDGMPVRPSKEISFINEPNGLIGLTIDRVRPEDAGVYSLVVWNTLGEVTGLSNVEVEEKERRPDFLGSLQPITVVEGFPAKLEVKTVGKPAPLLKWMHNGEEVRPDGRHVSIVSQPDGRVALMIDEATPEDAGEYAVVASNSQGETACKAKLEVSGKSRPDLPEEKPSFLCPLRDASVEEGQPLILSASFVGNPIPEVSWTKDGEVVKPELTGRTMLSCDGKRLGLEINPSEPRDAGVYRCKIKNPLGEDECGAEAIVRKVFQPPKFTQRFSDLQQLPNCDAKFPARVIGVPRPDIAWYFNDAPILADSGKYKMKRDGDACCLYVKDCTPEDSGRYTCKAVNKEGEVECGAKLDVVQKIDKSQRVEPPSFMKRIGDCEIYRGMAAKFTACVTGIPEPEFEWFRNDDKLWPTDRIQMDQEGSLLRLTIRHVDDLDAGTYRLRIFNPHGEDSCSAELIYESLEPRSKKPLADQYTDYDKYRKSGIPLPLADRPIISRMMDRHLTLSWKPSIPIGPRIPVTYLVEMCELPDGEWFTARSGIRSCLCDIRNLIPFKDYKFRVRVENKYGISDPSPFAQTYRAKLEPEPPKFFPYLAPGIDFRPETSPYFPKDFDIERPPHDGYAQAPRFLRQEHDTQYGVKNHNCNLFWFVYGYPKPKMTYYFNDELIESGGRYDQSYTRNGQATLFINKMLERDEGIYEAVASNEHGEARQRVKLACAEYPAFLQRPEETIVLLRRSGTLTARVTGVPYPDIKWFKDWKPIAASSRIKIQFVEPDTSILTIDEAIAKDEGLYSISAGNVAGSISSSVMVHVEMNEQEFGYRTYRRKPDIKAKDRAISDAYDLGDELGRGTQGVTYHAVERSTGRNFAAKTMHGLREFKPFMVNELDVMNNLNHRKLLRLHDAYERDNSLTLVMELAAGGELAENLTRQPSYTEREVAGYIRQLLQGLEYMHDNHYAHLGLTLGDLMIAHPGGDELKLGDFGLARRISSAKLMTLTYGVPEYLSPEVSNNEGVSYPTDMWAVGIITHILLSGISPFRAANDKETLIRIREGRQLEFDNDRWNDISNEAKDFIRSLLVYQPEKRLNVRAALAHPWFSFSLDSHHHQQQQQQQQQQHRIPSEYLGSYYKLFREWYGNASCRTWYRRRRLSCAFEHPTRMIYPPGYRFTPEPETPPSRRPQPPHQDHGPWYDYQLPTREPIDTEIGLVKSEGHYQTGPDTYLLQLRDTGFPVRLREYMKVACNRSPGYSRSIAEDQHFDWRAPIIRERRRFTDVMDEEIDDERRERINRYGAPDNFTTPRRLKHELGTRLESYVEADAMLESKKKGHPPFFREKPQIKPIQEGKRACLSCLVVGDPNPSVQWYKNDLLIQETKRIKVTEDSEGRSILSFEPAKEHDIGIYKVVARNPLGQSIVRTRVLLASVPSAPDSPEATEVSDTEVLLRWKQPKDDGNSAVLCYNLQYREGDAIQWIDAASNIDHEFFVVKSLKQDTSYNFRLAARNRIGWSEHGIPTKLIKTKAEGSPKVQVTRAMKHLQQLTESGQEIVLEEDKVHIDYSQEESPVEWSAESQPSNKYSFISELFRGEFSVVVKGIERATNRVIVAKILELGSSNEQEKQVNREYEALRSLRHERIALLEAAYKSPGSPLAVFILEKLQGADVVSYFSSRHEYSENCVATVIAQILDGLQYLHWRGFCHLDIQPDNVVMASVRSVQVKLVDFGSARRVNKLGTQVLKSCGHPEYRAPEIYADEMAYPQTDIWMVGVLTYVLLSGVSPFRGKDPDETRQNITFVRYRFEHLYKELSQEATRFLMLLFKRAPSKRPVTEECHEHRWLMPTEYMIKKRERAIFLGNRLKEYSDAYHEEKLKSASQTDNLATEAILGSSRQLIRSTSIQDELLTTF